LTPIYPAETDQAPPAKLAILGPFSLCDGQGREVAVGSKKNKALLAILALSPNRTMARERIATLLWGSHGEEQARNSLRQSLAVMRRELAPSLASLIESSDDLITLAGSNIVIDVLEVLSGADHPEIAKLRRAAGFCRGELLADLFLEEASFEDWLASERSRIRAAAIRLFDALSQHETGPQRVEAAQQLLTIDPLRESSHRMLMRAYAEQGDNGLALKQYEHCRDLLRAELQVEPAKETQELRREIAQGIMKPRAVSASAAFPVISSSPELPDRPSIAVLPFGNANPNQTDLYFSDGISEDLIANLSRFRHLFVIARASSFSYRGASAGPKEIGRRLGVRFLLFGTVRRAGDRLRVTAELVDAQSEAAIWVEKYDRPANDVFGVIDELSETIVASTVGRIESEVLRQTRRKQTGSLAAYELVLQGKALMHSPLRDDKLAARRMFEEAISLDKDFAMARAQLAYTYLYEAMFYESAGWDDSRKIQFEPALDRAADIASQGLLVDEDEAWCHMVLGLTYLHRRKYDLALKHCERSVHLNPNDPGLAAKLGLVLIDLGRATEAFAVIERAIRLNPINPDAYSDYLALALMGARRFEEAAKVLEAAPEASFYYYGWLAICYVQLGDVVKAKSLAAKATEIAPGFTLSQYAATEPYRDPADLQFFVDSLRVAGIRE
jgi:TolB-like protein/DNA-binding SARP family transcriptional activator